MTWKTLTPFFKTLTADDMYSLLSRDNLKQPNQMHLSQKQKTFPQFFCAFLKSTSNFQDSEKKMTVIAYVFPKLRTPKYVVREMHKKSRFRRPVDRQHGKRVETLIQSQRQHLYHIN